MSDELETTAEAVEATAEEVVAEEVVAEATEEVVATEEATPAE